MGTRCRHHAAALEAFFDERRFIVTGVGRRRRRDDRFDALYSESERRVIAAGVPPMFTLRSALRDLAARSSNEVDISEEIGAADHANRVLRALVDDADWPTQDEFGWTGAFAAAALVGHADDAAPLRRAALSLMRRGLERGEVDPRRFAHLVDRARSMDGKPQLYGTLFVPVAGVPKSVWPMVPDDEMGRARHKLGLPPFDEDRRRYERGARPGPFLIPYTRRDWITLGARLTVSGLRHGGRSHAVRTDQRD